MSYKTLLKDRALYLEHPAEDRANGFAPARELQRKTTPVMVTRPGTRDGFFPAFLPKYPHHIPADYPELLWSGNSPGSQELPGPPCAPCRRWA